MGFKWQQMFKPSLNSHRCLSFTNSFFLLHQYSLLTLLKIMLQRWQWGSNIKDNIIFNSRIYFLYYFKKKSLLKLKVLTIIFLIKIIFFKSYIPLQFFVILVIKTYCWLIFGNLAHINNWYWKYIDTTTGQDTALKSVIL